VISITDEVDAFSVLEKFDAADFDFTVHHARFLRSDKQFAFLLFCCEGVAKGARVFLFDNPPVAGDIENNLLSELMNFQGDKLADAARELALETVREFLETKSADHYFFDAH
jgi:hypothetical protein